VATGEVEHLTGIGEIYAGDHLLRRARYELTVSSWNAGGSLDDPPIVGSIDITGMGEAVVLAGPERLTLKLEDGRRVVFNLSSTAGRIRGHALQDT
jgi:hypothetical protein